MASGNSPTELGSDANSYPLQRHAGKVGYGPNFASGASLVDRISGLATEIKGKVTHNPALVHHGHEIFTGEAKRKKALGIEDDDSTFGSGTDSSKKPRSSPPASGRPTGTIASSADPTAENAPSFASVAKNAKESASGGVKINDKGPSVEHLKHS